MTSFYNPPKDSPFASVGISDWDAINSTIEFQELRAVSDDEYYYLFLYATKFTDVVKIGERDWHFEPQLVTFQVGKTEIVKFYDYKQKKQSERNQSFVEKLVCYALKNCDPAKAYKGFIVLQKSGAIELALAGVDTSGDPMPELVRSQLLATAFKLEETDTELIPVDEVKVKEKKSWGNGSKGQTEKEKMNDRLTFLIEQIRGYKPELELKGLGDIIDACKADSSVQNLVDWFVLVCK